MFSIDPAIERLPAKRENVVAIIESVNQPHVGIPGKTPQPAKAYVCGLRNSNATFSLFVFMLLTKTNETVVYVFHERQFPLESYRDAEADALQFVESMGFMVENLNFRNQPAGIQEELLQRIPAFAAAPVAPPAPPAVAPGEAPGERLARLLAAF